MYIGVKLVYKLIYENIYRIPLCNQNMRNVFAIRV